MNRIKTHIIAFTVSAIAASCGIKETEEERNLRSRITDRNGGDAIASDGGPADPTPGLESGDWLYGRYCASCHSPLATSTKKGRNSEAITKAIKDIPGMTSLKSLTPAQIDRIAASLADPTNRPPQPAELTGAQLYAANCASCHGELASSNKKNATAARIKGGITAVAEMRSLSRLTDPEINAIAGALTVTSPTPEPTPDPRTQGIALYTNNCQSCHGPVDASSKRNATVASIDRAIKSVNAMSFLNFLTQQQLTLIQDVLRESSDRGTDRIAKMSNRDHLRSRFTRIFVSPTDTTGGTNATTILNQEILSRPDIFGGNCHRYDSDCKTAGNGIASYATFDPNFVTSPLRAGFLNRACVRIVNNNTFAEYALASAGLTATSAHTVANIGKLANHFVPALTISNPTLEYIRAVGQKVSTTPSVETWRAMMLPLCSSSAVDVLSPGGSQVEIYARCHLQFAGMDIQASDARIAAIRANTKTAVQACGELIDAVSLSAQNGMIDMPNATKLSTLRNMHRLNAALFLNRDTANETQTQFRDVKRNVYDTSAPALWLTRAMFTPGVRADSLFLENANLKPVRTGGERATAFVGNIDKTKTVFSNLVFADEGDINGIISSGLMSTSYSFTNTNNQTVAGAVEFGKTFGGGVIGSPVYLQSVEFFETNPDAAGRMPRGFGKAVFKDFLCRSMPAVHIQDVDKTAFVDPASTIAFRTSPSCVSCHASMDRVASVARGFFLRNVGEGSMNNNKLGTSIIDQRVPDRPAEAAWPVTPDNEYHRRPPTGRLYFRDHSDVLVDQPLNGLNSLGERLAALDDSYICLTSKYYEFLTGVTVDITPAGLTNSNDDARRHREKVIEIGKSLKQHQNLRRMLKDIVASDGYQK